MRAKYGDQVSVKPNSFAQIAEISQSAEVVIIRENKERNFQTSRQEKGSDESYIFDT